MTIYDRKLLSILIKIFRKRIKLFTQNEEIWKNFVIGGTNNPSELRARPVQWGWRLRRVPFHSSFIIFLTRDFFVNYLYHKCFSGHLKWFTNNRVCQKEINPDHKRRTGWVCSEEVLLVESITDAATMFTEPCTKSSVLLFHMANIFAFHIIFYYISRTFLSSRNTFL